ncbi:BMP family ABC transporter substrate-binding protein [Vibrio sp. PP-XX7]
MYAAAGGTGLGVYQAAADAGKYAIGVDSNQNHLHPGTMLTSMVKMVGAAARESWTEEMNGRWKPGIKVLGLKENAINWSLDQYNKSLISEQLKAYMATLKQDIISGKIKVHDYMSDNTCKY